MFTWRKKAETNKFDVCLLVGTGWHVVHEQIPVLIWLKEKYKKVKVLCLIIEYNGLINAERSEWLYNTLLAYSDAVVMHDWRPCEIPALSRLSLSIHKKIMKKKASKELDEILKHVTVNSVFFGEDTVTFGFKYVCERFSLKNGVRYFSIGGTSHSRTLDGSRRIAQRWELNNELAQRITLFICDKEDADYLSSKRKGIVFSGSPLFDPWWMKNFKLYFKKQKQKGKKKIIGIAFSKLNTPDRLSEHDEREILSFINDNEDYEYCLSFHPRDQIKYRRKLLKKIHSPYIIFNDGLMLQSASVDVMIVVGFTTGVADALVASTPVIEFYDDRSELYYNLGFYKKEDKQYGTWFYLNDLLPHARSAKKLKEQVDMIVLDNKWVDYQNRCRKDIPQIPSCDIIAQKMMMD